MPGDATEQQAAIAEYHKAIELDPKDASAHYNLGVALYDKGQLDDAIAEYKKAIELDPKLALAHGALGQPLLARGRFAEARATTSPNGVRPVQRRASSSSGNKAVLRVPSGWRR